MVQGTKVISRFQLDSVSPWICFVGRLYVDGPSPCYCQKGGSRGTLIRREWSLCARAINERTLYENTAATESRISCKLIEEWKRDQHNLQKCKGGAVIGVWIQTGFWDNGLRRRLSFARCFAFPAAPNMLFRFAHHVHITYTQSSFWTHGELGG